MVCGFCGVARRGFHTRNTAPGKHSGKLMRGKAHGAHKLYDLQVFRFGFLRFKPDEVFDYYEIDAADLQEDADHEET